MNYKKYILLPVILGLTNLMAQGQDSSCAEKTFLQEISFTKNQIKLNAKNKATLDSIFLVLNKCPKHSLVMIMPFSEISHRNALNWDRLNSAALYVIEKGIDAGRVTFNQSNGTNYETINLKLALTESPQDSLQHPNLRKNEAAKPKASRHDHL